MFELCEDIDRVVEGGDVVVCSVQDVEVETAGQRYQVLLSTPRESTVTSISIHINILPIIAM